MRVGVRECLVMDHMYVAISAEHFASLLPLIPQLSASSHQKVQVSDDAWEGIYLSSRTGAYFELLNERRPEGLGMAFCAHKPFMVDVEEIVQELPQLPWRKGMRSWPDGRPWFGWYSLGAYEDSQSSFFNAWAMKYFFCPMAEKRRPIPCTIDRFRKLQMTLGQKHVQEVLALSAWFPGRREQDGQHIAFDFMDRDGSPVSVNIEVLPGEEKFTFKKIEMDLVRGHALNSQKLGAFSFDVQGDSAVLSLL